ncbi:MAG: hypothetical protein KGM98_14425 [Bacteroidota bacterium]|nr:hypothetical protein [Bacteroidota bacterium]
MKVDWRRKPKEGAKDRMDFMINKKLLIIAGISYFYMPQAIFKTTI